MKKVLKALLLIPSCLVLVSCASDKVSAKSDPCFEPRLVSDAIKKRIEEIGARNNPINIKSTGDVVIYLAPGFNIDNARCSGFTTEIRSASNKIIRERETEILPYLRDICMRQTEPGEIDTSLLARMQEEKKGAGQALIFLGRPGECISSN